VLYISPAGLYRSDTAAFIAANVLADFTHLWERVQQQGDSPKRPELSVGKNLKPRMALVILASPAECVQQKYFPCLDTSQLR
jgi:hypothetical protein